MQDIQDHAARWTHAADTLQAAVNTAGELPVWDVKISYCNRDYDVHTCDMNTLLFREFWARALDEDPDHLIMLAPPFKAGDELVDHKTLADQGVTQGSLVILIRSEVAYGHAIVGAVSGEPLTRSLATNARTAERIAARTLNANVPCITASYVPGIGYTCIAVPRPIGSIWYTIGEPGATVGNLPAPYYDVRPNSTIATLFDRGTQIGRDHSIIYDGDFVYHCDLHQLGEVDYFHGMHTIRYGELGCAHAPQAMVDTCTRDHIMALGNDPNWIGEFRDHLYEDHWFAHDMILVRGLSCGLQRRRDGPPRRLHGRVIRCIHYVQHLWRERMAWRVAHAVDCSETPIQIGRFQQVPACPDNPGLTWFQAAHTLRTRLDPTGTLPTVQIFVNWCGNVFTIEVCDVDLWRFRHFFASSLRVSLPGFAVTFKSFYLEDSQTLFEQGVVAHSELVFCIRNRGGGRSAPSNAGTKRPRPRVTVKPRRTPTGTEDSSGRSEGSSGGTPSDNDLIAASEGFPVPLRATRTGMLGDYQRGRDQGCGTAVSDDDTLGKDPIKWRDCAAALCARLDPLQEGPSVRVFAFWKDKTVVLTLPDATVDTVKQHFAGALGIHYNDLVMSLQGRALHPQDTMFDSGTFPYSHLRFERRFATAAQEGTHTPREPARTAVPWRAPTCSLDRTETRLEKAQQGRDVKSGPARGGNCNGTNPDEWCKVCGHPQSNAIGCRKCGDWVCQGLCSNWGLCAPCQWLNEPDQSWRQPKPKKVKDHGLPPAGSNLTVVAWRKQEAKRTAASETALTTSDPACKTDQTKPDQEEPTVRQTTEPAGRGTERAHHSHGKGPAGP